jgi:hypothetical protein
MINHKHKFIFIAIHKTGTTSAFSFLLESIEDGWGMKRRQIDITKHQILEYYKEKYPKKYDEYFKFTFVRNPWSRAVSLYLRGESTPAWKNQTFKDFVKDMQGAWANTDGPFWANGTKGFYKNQIDMARLRGSENLETDFIGKTENLENDLRFICKKIDLDFDEKIWKERNMMNISKKRLKDKKHYSEYYDEETKNIIAEKFAEDIEYFGYKFESRNNGLEVFNDKSQG